MSPWWKRPKPPAPRVPLATESTGCRAERHDLCSAPASCPCRCHSESHVEGSER